MSTDRVVKTILLIEDDADLCSLMSAYFGQHGLQVEASTNGASGLARAIDGAQLRLIFHQYGATYFLSRIWPDMGGRELLESRKERELTEMRIALVTVLAEK